MTMHPLLNVGATVHWKGQPGVALCAMSPGGGSAMPGDWLSADEAEVDCRECIELRHA